MQLIIEPIHGLPSAFMKRCQYTSHVSIKNCASFSWLKLERLASIITSNLVDNNNPLYASATTGVCTSHGICRGGDYGVLETDSAFSRGENLQPIFAVAYSPFFPSSSRGGTSNCIVPCTIVRAFTIIVIVASPFPRHSSRSSFPC